MPLETRPLIPLLQTLSHSFRTVLFNLFLPLFSQYLQYDRYYVILTTDPTSLNVQLVAGSDTVLRTPYRQVCWLNYELLIDVLKPYIRLEKQTAPYNPADNGQSLSDSIRLSVSSSMYRLLKQTLFGRFNSMCNTTECLSLSCK